jgi:hypothetical protein
MAIDGITIRFANLDDVDRIMEVIGRYWDSNHILTRTKEFFLYIFTGDKNNINFVIAEDKTTHEITGFLGYIRYASAQVCDISPVMWKALEEKGEFLGLKMLLFLVNKNSFDFIFSVGINPKTIPIYRYLRYYTGRLDHYYRISDKDVYKIAEIKNKIILPVSPSELEISLIENFSSFCKVFNFLFPLEKQHPNKDIDYFHYRFFDHPIYSYKIFCIVSKNTKQCKAFFVGREVEQFGIKILRIVDFAGQEEYFADISVSLQNLIEQNNYEYIDFYSYGISTKTMNRAGFVKRMDNDDNIIPNYFEPFVRKNCDIHFYTNSTDNVRLFKADADQDQPRLFEHEMI